MNDMNRIWDALYNPIERQSVVEWAETNRTLTKEISSSPGRMSYRITPYLKKIANSVMADNPAQIISVMKGSQIGWSIGGIFSIMGWIIGQSPGNILFITENDDKIKEQMQGAISQMINSSGLGHLVGSHNLREYREAGNRRTAGTGDTVKGLDFKDGKLYTYSGQKIGSLSSISIKYGLYDEVERWKGTYKKAGSFLGLVEPRHRSFGSQRKLFFGSTPEVKQTSNIEPLYNDGNREKYSIPCKHCGSLVDLRWSTDIDGNHAGITYKRDNMGKYVENSAEYICQSCGKTFTEVHKFDMYEEEYYAYSNRDQDAEDYDNFKTDYVCQWIPTAEPKSYIYQSFHISSMYAPMGFYSWNDMARKWCELHPVDAPVQIRGLQTFINQELGETWEEKSRDVRSSHLRKNCRYYDVGVIPDNLSKADGNGEIVAVTCAVDINGIMGDNYEDGEDDIRIDYEVVAWAERGENEFVVSYSIDQGSIGNFKRSRDRKRDEKQGKLVDTTKWTLRNGYENSVWDEFEKKVLLREWDFESKGEKGGRSSQRIMLCGIDTGNFTTYANDFVSKHDVCVGIKGGSDTGYTKLRAMDKPFVKEGTKHKLYIAEGNIVKNVIADEIELSWSQDDGVLQPMGFMNFPYPTKTKYQYKTYFKEFEGEHKIMEIGSGGEAVGFKWEKKHSTSPNHFWDCRCYNFVLQQILTKMVCKKYKMDVSWKNYSTLMVSMKNMLNKQK